MEIRVIEIDSFIEKTPDFFEKFDGHCLRYRDGLIFYKKNMEYPENCVYHNVQLPNWESITDVNWPNDGYGTATVYEEFPDYVFFEAELKPRFFVYTRGEYPSKLIDNCWEGYNLVLVEKMAKGWYDINPVDKKDDVGFWSPITGVLG